MLVPKCIGKLTLGGTCCDYWYSCGPCSNLTYSCVLMCVNRPPASQCSEFEVRLITTKLEDSYTLPPSEVGSVLLVYEGHFTMAVEGGETIAATPGTVVFISANASVSLASSEGSANDIVMMRANVNLE